MHSPTRPRPLVGVFFGNLPAMRVGLDALAAQDGGKWVGIFVAVLARAGPGRSFSARPA